LGLCLIADLAENKKPSALESVGGFFVGGHHRVVSWRIE